ncbi:CwfJ C-terminus 1-domain-containing protein-like protein [Multifurca ochricompacta]|uniref:CwfJ C-terminus 1-domain-containing protein-like protein n=1 Tax=Multifurca ochricompacta TaxID=376703 RepID=A0AAD4M7I1_9AGAM|nr:CwfJ C-terminus 1-domain-containing protein-like protein [Multifurca ochricompacta]
MDSLQEHKHKSKSKKRHRHGDSDEKHKYKKYKEKDRETIVRGVDDDFGDEDIWVEKNIDMDGEKPLTTVMPTVESLKLTSRARSKSDDPHLPKAVATESSLKRDDWMLDPSVGSTTSPATFYPIREGGDESLTEGYGEPSTRPRTLGGGIDFFSGLGKEREKKAKPDLPDPDKLHVSSKELNTQLKEGKSLNEHSEAQGPKLVAPGGPGSQWRMMRLRRVYETAQEDNRPVEEVAVERFGSFEAFEQAREERRILDERQGKRIERGREVTKGKRRMEPNHSKAGEKSFIFNDLGGSGASSRSSSFRRPGGPGESAPSTPSPHPVFPPDARPRFDSLRLSQTGTPGSHARTPVPSVMTPQLVGKRALSPSSLNRLQAKVLRAKLTGGPDAEKLEKEYEEEMQRASGTHTNEDGIQTRTRVEVLPTLDARGRLYDVGHGKDDGQVLPGNRKKKEKVETRDPKTGEIVRYNADDDTTTLGELLRQEKFNAGMADQKNLDMQFAHSIMTDGGFVNDLEYMDDNAEKLGRQKMRSDAMKRQFAIQDYKRTQKALASCPFCYGEDDSLPKAPMVALGTRVYLSCSLHEELTPGHCLIVPIQHHLTMLEGDDDVWDEVRNFMKSIMRMYAEEDKGVVFYETVISLKWQKHSVIECVPVPWEQFDVLPGYFKESILMSEAEWSQHKKLIDFATRPGGFRRMMVPNLPYFMVQFDYKGEKGYGHVIEGSGGTAGEEELDEGEKGGGDFPRYFAGEIIGNLLELEPRRWRHPRRQDFGRNKERVTKFKKVFDRFDWTGLMERSRS